MMESKMSVEDETKDSNTISTNSQITEILELIFDYPDAEKEMKSILSNFWEKYKNCISEGEDYCESDVLCMYALSYVYENNGLSESAVARSVYCYLKQLNICRENRNILINCTKSCCKKVLREFTNFDSPEGEYVLIDVLMKCLLGGNLGLSQFLVKFGLVEFPNEANDKSRKIIGRLVKWFNSIYSIMPEEQRISIEFDDLFSQMEQFKSATFRRLIFILCSLCIIAEYREADDWDKRYNLNEFTQHMRWHSIRKLICLDLFVKMTTESLITFKDISTFLSTILIRQISKAIRMPLLETTRKLFCEKHNSYKPRSLMHLVRCKIRDRLRKSAVLPQSVYELPLPVAVKEFITFEEKEIWKALKVNQEIFYLEHKMCRSNET